MQSKRGSRNASPKPNGDNVEKTQHEDPKEYSEGVDSSGTGYWSNSSTIAVAVIAVLVAVGVRCFGPASVQHSLTLDGVADLAFGCLKTDVVTFALPAAYFRWTVPARDGEPLMVRAALAVVLGAVAMGNLHLRQQGQLDDFALLCGVTVALYAAMAGHMPSLLVRFVVTCGATTLAVLTVKRSWYFEVARGSVGLGTAWLVDFAGSFASARWQGQFQENLALRVALAVGSLCAGVVFLSPLVTELTMMLLPLAEMAEAYALAGTFVGEAELRNLTEVLMIVTIFCQVALGYLGIDFLKAAQGRKNQLILIEQQRQNCKRLHAICWPLHGLCCTSLCFAAYPR